jgi:tight adherence protein C
VGERMRHYRPGLLENLAPDLAITQRDQQSWLTKVLAIALTFAIAPTVLMAGRRLDDQQVALQWAPVIGLALAATAVALSIKDLRDEAARAREEYTRALSIYLDLVAMSMEAGQGHAQALPAASQIGTGRAFGEIRSSIDLAPSRGITAWQALGQLGERYRIAELISLRASIELAQDDGARVKASLIARAETMRSARLAAAVERANKATQSMRQLTLIAAVLAAAYICAPYILALRGAAG